MAQIIIITSGKGGTGKTSVTALLGHALAKRGRRVLLTDTGSGVCDLGIMLGTQARTVYDLGDLLSGACEARDAILEAPSQKGLFLLPAPCRGAVSIDMDGFCEIIRSLSGYFDDILIDAQPRSYIGDSALLSTAALALIVCTPDPLAVMDCRMATDSIYEAGLPMRLIINMARPDFAGCGHIADFDGVIDGVGAQLIGVIPPDSAILGLFCQSGALQTGATAFRAADNIAGRLLGAHINLLIN